ncbi:hypothetical protein CBM2623_A190085 [Cupriavidus taiwanensis]|nr:hypothetical protein CBM2623_A190085 [Cupriavidus taiwanensis]
MPSLADLRRLIHYGQFAVVRLIRDRHFSGKSNSPQQRRCVQLPYVIAGTINHYAGTIMRSFNFVQNTINDRSLPNLPDT